MNNEAASAGTASAKGVFHAETFIHPPRPAYVPNRHPDQRHFGEDRYEAVCGVTNSGGSCEGNAAVNVNRLGQMPGVARIEVFSRLIDGTAFSAAIKLSPAQLRELARRLIDAAADIEAEERQGGAA